MVSNGNQPLSATYWLAPAHTPASIILDLGCTQVIEGLTMKNTRNAYENDRGLNRFTIAVSNTTQGPWRTVLEDQLPDVRNSSCDVPLVNFTLPAQLSQEARTARAVKLQVVSWYGNGAGLQYLKIHSQQPSSLGVGAVVGLILLAAVSVSLLGLAWTRRNKMRSLLKDKDRCKTVVQYITQHSQQVLVEEEDMVGCN